MDISFAKSLVAGGAHIVQRMNLGDDAPLSTAQNVAFDTGGIFLLVLARVL